MAFRGQRNAQVPQWGAKKIVDGAGSQTVLGERWIPTAVRPCGIASRTDPSRWILCGSHGQALESGEVRDEGTIKLWWAPGHREIHQPQPLSDRLSDVQENIPTPGGYMGFPCNQSRWLLCKRRSGKPWRGGKVILPKRPLLLSEETDVAWITTSNVFHQQQKWGLISKYGSPLKPSQHHNSWSHLRDAPSFHFFAPTSHSSRWADLPSGNWRAKRTVKGSYLGGYCSGPGELCHCPHSWPHPRPWPKSNQTAICLSLHNGHRVLCTNLLCQAPSSAVPLLGNLGKPAHTLGLGLLIFKIWWRW